jgi:hypothetical protein
MPGWRIARAFRAIYGIYRIPHTLMTQGSMILRETCIGHWRETPSPPFAKGADARSAAGGFAKRKHRNPNAGGIGDIANPPRPLRDHSPIFSKGGKPKKEPRLASGLQVRPGSFRASSCSRLPDQKAMIRR